MSDSTVILASDRDPEARGGEVVAVELKHRGGVISVRVIKGQDYGKSALGQHYPPDGINWFHVGASARLEPSTARWLATELNGMAAAVDGK